ncbi:hypothetical protein APA_558 [Pseudanabaena sp. lw0831]|uniref:DUF1822 family protein n=1 Tax=Pseudanabaena sp. lw0831 TaxID=1357935 RepID=UPI001915A890|nr:DUF1822 family protein [Pseudanabaena sp. lw0831]GBO51594.1 hypothetical protein APA_558 [Pseudanabaena sp. lw0831]
MISEFDTIPLDAIALSPDLIRHALALSQSDNKSANKNANSQWQDCIDAIAYLSIGEWLRDRLSNISLDVTEANCFQVNGFTIYVLAMTRSAGDSVEIPINVIDLETTNSKHSNLFIVAVEIQEEIEQALVLGFIRHAQLIEHLPELDRLDNTCQVPLSLFDDQPERLLLYLQHLEPVLETVRAFQPEAITELPQVNMTELILNTGLWLQSQLDEIAQTLAWQLLPTWQPNYASALRSPATELQTIVSEVARLTVDIPPHARAAYQDFQLGDRHLRLYATVWADGDRTENPEWTLLLVLGSQSSNEIPYGVRMRIRDQQQVLVDRRLEPNTNDIYLYACVTGEQNEAFTVSISLPSGVMLTLPAFAFYPNAL